MLVVIWSMVGSNEGIELGVSCPLENLPSRSMNKPLPKKKKNRVRKSTHNNQQGHKKERYVLSLKVLYTAVRKPYSISYSIRIIKDCW